MNHNTDGLTAQGEALPIINYPLAYMVPIGCRAGEGDL